MPHADIPRRFATNKHDTQINSYYYLHGLHSASTLSMPSKENVLTKADWKKSQIYKCRDVYSSTEYIVMWYERNVKLCQAVCIIWD